MSIEGPSATIAAQNDRFRTSMGQDPEIKGRIVITRSLADLGPLVYFMLLQKVRQHSEFPEDVDPYGDHSFGKFALEVFGDTIDIWWRIDLYDEDYHWGSEVPDDPARTRRVLTVMLPSDH